MNIGKWFRRWFGERPTWTETMRRGVSVPAMREAILDYAPAAGWEAQCARFQELMMDACREKGWDCHWVNLYYMRKVRLWDDWWQRKPHSEQIGHGIVIGEIAGHWWAAGPRFYFDEDHTSRSELLKAVCWMLSQRDNRHYDTQENIIAAKHRADELRILLEHKKGRGNG